MIWNWMDLIVQGDFELGDFEFWIEFDLRLVWNWMVEENWNGFFLISPTSGKIELIYVADKITWTWCGGVDSSCGIGCIWRSGRALELVVEAVVAAAEGVFVRPVAAVVLEVADLGGVDAAGVVALELAGAAAEEVKSKQIADKINKQSKSNSTCRVTHQVGDYMLFTLLW